MPRLPAAVAIPGTREVHALNFTLPPQLLSALLYLLPSVALALAIRSLRRWIYLFALFALAGTLVHEALHFLVGALVGARPTSFSILPKHSGQNRYTLGMVTFANANWLNSAAAGLAPLLALPIVVGIAWWRVQAGWQFTAFDLGIWALLAPQLLSCWPSSADWKLALRSWPLLLAVAGGAWYFAQ